MSEEKLMRKYGYGYKHSKDLLNEPYVKDLQQRIDNAIKYIEKFILIDNNTILMRERQRDYLLEILKGDSND